MGPFAALLLAANAHEARAQMGGGPGMGPAGQAGGDEEEKPEGAAEKAPKDPSELPSAPALGPYPGEKKKAFELIQLDGYFRLRTDWKNNFHMGFHDRAALDDDTVIEGGTPYPEPLSCQFKTSANRSTCGKIIGSANMRLRLEPTINLSEKVSVHAQVDVLDNLVLGSTDRGTFLDDRAPSADVSVGAFDDNQVTPEGGLNSRNDSVRVKRAWAEVETPLGLLKFGRMPSQWGMGIAQNAGGTDPLTGKHCDDCNGGDTVDRVSFSLGIPGTPFTGAIAMDWAGTGATSERTLAERDSAAGYQPADLDDADDVRQWTFVFSDLTSPEERRDRLDLGDVVFDWGLMVTYRRQDWDLRANNAVETSLPEQFRLRKMYSYTPDAFVRLDVGKLTLEAEAVMSVGEVGQYKDFVSATEGCCTSDIRSFGGVARLTYLLADDDLELGAEVGYASGDDWEAARPGQVNYQDVPILPGDIHDDTISAFLFDPNYHVDYILFREILGTVRNATYVKPRLGYDLTSRLRLDVAGIMSFANKLVSTPGNASLWGLELDGSLAYHNDREGFSAGIAYGVLFPLGALDHPADTDLFQNPLDQGDADTSQVIKMNLMLKF